MRVDLPQDLPSDRSVVIMAIDGQRARGAVAEVTTSPGRQALLLRLRPLVPARVAFVASSTRHPLPVVWALRLSRASIRIADGRAEDGRIELPLPRARYYLQVDSEGHQGGWLRLNVGKRGADLGDVALQRTVRARLQGELAPEIHVTSALGLPDGVRLTDLRGKWILIDFWGHWCGPCLTAMPELIEFRDRHADRVAEFEILAFHDATVDSLEELRTKLVARGWSSWPLPFPVLTDSTGTTIERYGITEFPTLILIDPQGRIVDSTSGDGSRLLERLAEELR